MSVNAKIYLSVSEYEPASEVAAAYKSMIEKLQSANIDCMVVIKFEQVRFDVGWFQNLLSWLYSYGYHYSNILFQFDDLGTQHFWREAQKNVPF